MKLEKDHIFEAFRKRVGDKVEPIILKDMEDSIRDINLNKTVPEDIPGRMPKGSPKWR